MCIFVFYLLKYVRNNISLVRSSWQGVIFHMRSSKHARIRAGCSTDNTNETLTCALTRAGCSTDGTIEILTRALTRAGFQPTTPTKLACVLTRAGFSTDNTNETLACVLTLAGFLTGNTNETGGSRHSPPRRGRTE